MRTHKTLLCLASIAGLLLGAQLALADDPTPETSPPPLPGRKYCKENPGKCEEARAKHAAWCQENPEKCKERQEDRDRERDLRDEEREKKRAERRAYCKENPETCKAERAQRRQRKAEIEAKCKADPAVPGAEEQGAREPQTGNSDRQQQQAPEPKPEE
jgi:hypothetical protein